MEITVTGLAITADALRFGLRVEYFKDGPIRFASVLLPDDTLDWQALATLAAYLDRQTRRHLDRERELDDPLDLGLG